MPSQIRDVVQVDVANLTDFFTTSDQCVRLDLDLLISVLECYLTQTILINEMPQSHRDTPLSKQAQSNKLEIASHVSAFQALYSPSISPTVYLRRLARYSNSSPAVFIAAFIYLDQIQSSNSYKDLKINSLNAHRLILVAVLLATKYFDDVMYDNVHFARIGGVHLKELNHLEMILLKTLDFNLSVNVLTFQAFKHRILNIALETKLPQFSALPARLRDLGYSRKSQINSVPRSPTSSMIVSFESSWPIPLPGSFIHPPHYSIQCPSSSFRCFSSQPFSFAVLQTLHS